MWRVPRGGLPALVLLAVAGRDFNLGALIAIDEANAAGAVAGQRLRLVSRDDGYRAADTVRHVTSIIPSDAPVALIGLWGADSVKALLADGAIERAGLPVVGVRSGDVSLPSQAPLFHVRASYRDEVAAMLEQIRTLGITRAAVAHEDEPFAHEALGVARDAMAKAGITPAAVEAVRRDSLDVEAAAQAIARVQPQAVLLFANTHAAAAIVRSLRERQATVLLFTTSSVEADTLVAQIGPALARGAADVAMAMRNRTRSLGIPDERANFASLEGYLCARIAIVAIRRAGRDPRPSQVAAALGAAGWAGRALGRQQVLELNHTDTPSGARRQAADLFARRFAEYGGGRCRVLVFHSGQLGNDPQSIAQVGKGGLDFSVSATGRFASPVPGLNLSALAYLVDGCEHGWRLFDHSSWMSRQSAQLPAQGMRVLATWEAGLRSFTTKSPLTPPPDAKGRKIRIFDNEMLRWIMQAIGYEPVVMPVTDVYLALQQGRVDGQENPIDTILALRLFEVARHLTLTQHVYSPPPFVASEALWRRLSPADREAAGRAAREAAKFSRDAVRPVYGQARAQYAAEVDALVADARALSGRDGR